MSDDWIDAQLRRCTRFLEQGISATHLRMDRPGFGQSVVPRKGSVLASPVQANWDPEPDYFFHWLRDSALVMDAVAVLSASADTREECTRWNAHFMDFVRFSLKISAISGADFKDKSRRNIREDFMQWVRPSEEMAALKGDLILAEPRVNADGTPDFQQWSRPQYDGPALRALACLRHAELARAQKRPASRLLERLLRQDLDFTATYADKPCIGPWEEDMDQHYYTSVTQLGALHHGAAWADSIGDGARASRYREAAETIRRNMDLHWDSENNFYRAARHKVTEDPEDMLDIAVVMGVLHARLPDGRHSIHDDRVAATLARIEAMYEREFPINHNRAEYMGVAIGRYKADHYQGGGGWYFSTLAAAEYYYRAGQARRGDAVMALIKKTTPADGSLSEQFDRVSGAPRSARHLLWSYAAFITAAAARAENRPVLIMMPSMQEYKK